MKRFFTLALMVVIILSITACRTQPNPIAGNEPVNRMNAPEIVETGVSSKDDSTTGNITLDSNYLGALSPRLILALGTLTLAGTPQAVTPDQAPELVILWQALDNLTSSGTSADAEVNALILQIEQTLSSEQIAEINAMKLTQVELQRWALENGITIGTGNGQGTRQGMSQGANTTAEEKATRQALNGGVGNSENGLSATLTQFLVTYLLNIK